MKRPFYLERAAKEYEVSDYDALKENHLAVAKGESPKGIENKEGTFGKDQFNSIRLIRTNHAKDSPTGLRIPSRVSKRFNEASSTHIAQANIKAKKPSFRKEKR